MHSALPETAYYQAPLSSAATPVPPTFASSHPPFMNLIDPWHQECQSRLVLHRFVKTYQRALIVAIIYPLRGFEDSAGGGWSPVDEESLQGESH